MELWDAYDRAGNPTGAVLVRGEPVPNGIYHLVCCMVIRHVDGDFLLMRRSPEKEVYPNIWEIGAGGSVLQGETPEVCALREVAEETGLCGGKLFPMSRYVEDATQTIYQGFLYETSEPKDSVKLQPGETSDYRWLTKAEFLDFFASDACIERFKIRLKTYVDNLRTE